MKRRSIDKHKVRLSRSRGGCERAVLLLNVNSYNLRSLPRRRPTEISETEEPTTFSKSEYMDTNRGNRINWNSNDNDADKVTQSACCSCSEFSTTPIQSGATHAATTLPKSSPRVCSLEANHRYRNIHSMQRMRLLIFIKIILKCLDCDDPRLHLKAKTIVTECTRKNREGIIGYSPLNDVITRELRLTVGEVHWNRANRLMEYYLKKRVENP